MIRVRVCLLAVSALSSLSAQGLLPPARQQEIEKLVAQEMSRQNMPGLSIAVAVNGELTWSAGYGLADLENLVPAKALTMYRLASVSKPITAVAVMQLSEAGKIDLDHSIRRYVPTFPAKPWTITVRQLLGHLGGIRHYENSEEINSTRHYPDMLSPLKIFQNDPLVAEPGDAFITRHMATCCWAKLSSRLPGSDISTMFAHTSLCRRGWNVFGRTMCSP